MGRVVEISEKLICVTVQTMYRVSLRAKSSIMSASNVVSRAVMNAMIGSRRPKAVTTMIFLKNLVCSRDTSKIAHPNKANSSMMSRIPIARTLLYTPSQAPDASDHGEDKSHCKARAKIEPNIQAEVQARKVCNAFLTEI